MVYKRKLISKSKFNKLPFGAKFWDSDNVAIGPYTKIGRYGIITGFATDHMLYATANPINFTVTRVPEVFLQHNGSNI